MGSPNEVPKFDILGLPTEIRQEILAYLDTRELLIIALTWRHLSDDALRVYHRNYQYGISVEHFAPSLENVVRFSDFIRSYAKDVRNVQLHFRAGGPKRVHERPPNLLSLLSGLKHIAISNTGFPPSSFGPEPYGPEPVMFNSLMHCIRNQKPTVSLSLLLRYCSLTLLDKLDYTQNVARLEIKVPQ